MNLQSSAILMDGIIILVCTWAVLTHKVRTNSIEVLVLGMVWLAAALGMADSLSAYPYTPWHSLFMRCGLALAGVAYFTRVELLPRILKLREHFHEN